MSQAELGAPDTRRWHLAAFRDKLETGSDTQFRVLRAVEEEEIDGVRRASDIVATFYAKRLMRPLIDSTNQVIGAVWVLLKEYERNKRLDDTTSGLTGPIRAWLGELRAFDDHNKHEISRLFGKDSEPYHLFERSLSEEFDNVPNYRFACKLRNAVTHRIDPVSTMELQVGVGEDGPNRSLAFNSARLLAAYRCWGKDVRQDLEKVHSFPVEHVVREVAQSCERAVSKLLVSLEDEITSAGLVILRLAAECSPEFGHPILIVPPDYGADSPVLSSFGIRTDLAYSALAGVMSARQILGLPLAQPSGSTEEPGERGLGRWSPGEIDPEFLTQFPMPVPSDCWLRMNPDPTRGLPAVHIEVAWIASDVLHLATVAGFTLDSADGVDERAVIEQRQVPLASIARLTYDLKTLDGRAELQSGETLDHVPGLLVDPHLVPPGPRTD